MCFHSPYEAAAWTVIGRRIRIPQAARIRARMAEELGAAVDVHGQVLHAFPPPARLLRLDRFPGLTARKVQWLRGVGEAALQGRLDAAHLRSLPPARAMARLKEIPAIGDFSAELILVRGAGEPDFLSLHEPRLRRAVARAYGRAVEPTDRELERIAERWRPFRSWVTLLLRAHLEEQTGEIAGRRVRAGGPPAG